MNKKALILTPILPYPPDDGSRLRPYQIINFLSNVCDVDLISFYLPGEDIDSAKRFYKSLCKNIFFLQQKKTDSSLISKLFVYSVSFDNKREIIKIISENNYDLIIAEKIIMLSYFNNDTFKAYRIVIDSWGIDSKISYQLFLEEENILKKLFCFVKYIRHFLAEIYFLSKCDYIIAITDEVYRFYKKFLKGKKLFLIPNAVDVNYYMPLNIEIEKGKIVFVGIMNFLPNIDAVYFFVRQILPRLRGKVKFRFYIVGKNPSPEVFSLHNGSDVIVTGTVDDVRKYIYDCELVVVPLRMGSGLRNKVIQAMACGKCVVATKEACEGLNVKDGENILIADTPEEFVEKILMVFDNKNLRLKIEKNARKYVEDNFSYDIIKKKWIEFYEEILDNNNNRRQA
jgi:glycosyltransferase involved in cell wall biosynthesis